MLGDRRRCSGDQDLATLISGSRADVDDVVGLRDHSKVVLDDDMAARAARVDNASAANRAEVTSAGSGAHAADSVRD